jgi:hypothetical protein
MNPTYEIDEAESLPTLGFTEDNFCAVVKVPNPQAKDIKTKTRRLLTLRDRTQEEVNENPTPRLH